MTHSNQQSVALRNKPRVNRFKQLVSHPVMLTVPAIILFILAVCYPLMLIFIRSFSLPEWGLQNYTWFFSSQVNLNVLARTFTLSAWVTIICVICAFPYAFMMTIVTPRMRLIMMLCVLVPFWVSDVVRTLAWIILLQDSGLINSLFKAIGIGPIRLIRTPMGVTIGMTQVLLPFMVMPLYAVLRGIDLRLIQASRSLGASPFKAFYQVYLPLSLPGIYAGSLIVFILALGFYITPALLGGPSSTMLSTLVQQQVLTLLNWGRGGAMGVILLASTLLLLAIASPLMRQKYKISGGSR